jgi:hypothetical protein
MSPKLKKGRRSFPIVKLNKQAPGKMDEHDSRKRSGDLSRCESNKFTLLRFFFFVAFLDEGVRMKLKMSEMIGAVFRSMSSIG